MGRIEGMDIFLRDGDFGEKRIRTSVVVRIGVIKGNGTFVCIEDLPVISSIG